jgi:hypothetical protein
MGYWRERVLGKIVGSDRMEIMWGGGSYLTFWHRSFKFNSNKSPT